MGNSGGGGKERVKDTLERVNIGAFVEVVELSLKIRG